MTDSQYPATASWVAFTESSEEVLRLNKEGFHYRGQLVADAGEAHRLMVEFLKKHNEPTYPRLTVEDCANMDKHQGSYIAEDGPDLITLDGCFTRDDLLELATTRPALTLPKDQ
jgi:hypothetical protein